MNTIECIKTRRSIRRFTSQEVPDEVLDELLEAVRWAPSWANTQCWEIVIVKEEATKQKLADLLSSKNPARNAVLEAPIVLAFCAKKGIAGFKKGELATNKGDWFLFDMGIAGEHFCLAAHDKGLGTVHIGSMDHAMVDKLLGLPEDIETVELIPLGYPAKESKAPPRKELKEFVYIESYGKSLY